jgi:hypothetical protein
MRDLPIYISSFSTMRTGNYIYVDKTELIYNLFKTGLVHYYFLSRPRRFGKTLLISTLKEFFLGNRGLFKDLWIERSGYSWEKYSVIHLDFGTIAHTTAQALSENLSWTLDTIAQEHDIALTGAPSLEAKLITLVKELAKKQGPASVVLLIDEYDKPILDHIKNKDIASELRDILKSFYDVIKGLDLYLRAIFITGVSKFSKTSLFSGLNNLNDITLDPRAASLLGYTDEEIDQYFADSIEEVAHHMHLSKEVVRKNMRTWYNGYRFSEQYCKVYNPFSTLYLLEKRKFANYWF